MGSRPSTSGGDNRIWRAGSITWPLGAGLSCSLDLPPMPGRGRATAYEPQGSFDPGAQQWKPWSMTIQDELPSCLAACGPQFAPVLPGRLSSGGEQGAGFGAARSLSTPSVRGKPQKAAAAAAPAKRTGKLHRPKSEHDDLSRLRNMLAQFT